MKKSIKTFVILTESSTALFCTNGEKSAILSCSGNFIKWDSSVAQPAGSAKTNFSFIPKEKRDRLKAKIAEFFI